jgi:hypothetical protein
MEPVMKPKYLIRHLKPDGTIISKQEYEEAQQMGETVYIAAFVGCTYHSG